MNRIAYRWLILPFLLLVTWDAFPQDDSQLWTRASLGWTPTDQSKWETEWQWRRQSNDESDQQASAAVLESVRIWYHRKGSNNWSFSVSPFAYFQHHQAANDSISEAITRKEVRFSIAGQWQTTLHHALTMHLRWAVVHRHWLQEEHKPFRLRQRVGLAYSLSQQTSIVLTQEWLFENKPDNIVLDQTRWQALVRHQMGHSFQAEMGYMQINSLGYSRKSAHLTHVSLVQMSYVLDGRRDQKAIH